MVRLRLIPWGKCVVLASSSCLLVSLKAALQQSDGTVHV